MESLETAGCCFQQNTAGDDGGPLVCALPSLAQHSDSEDFFDLDALCEESDDDDDDEEGRSQAGVDVRKTETSNAVNLDDFLAGKVDFVMEEECVAVELAQERAPAKLQDVFVVADSMLEPGLMAAAQQMGLPVAYNLDPAYQGSDASSAAASEISPTTEKPEDRDHPIVFSGGFRQQVRFVKSNSLASLPPLLPRCQEVEKTHFDTPTMKDLVWAVSHCWSNERHPDPHGWKRDALLECLASVDEGGHSRYLFLDFLSVPQKPFQHSQLHRTQDQNHTFRMAQLHMRNIYFMADRIVHLSPRVEESQDLNASGCAGIDFDEPLEAFGGAVVEDMGKGLFLITGFRGPPPVMRRYDLYDCIISINGVPLESVDHFEEMQQTSYGEHVLVRCRRFSFGRPNTVSAGSRGWVYLERFITAVKLVMLNKADADQVVVTDSVDIKRQLFSCADRLAEAVELQKQWAAGKIPGASPLVEALGRFEEELSTKVFSPRAYADRQDPYGKKADTDAALVIGIMQDFVHHLGRRWNFEVSRQRARAFNLNQYRGSSYTSDRFAMETQAVMMMESRSSLRLVLVMMLPLLLSMLVYLPHYAPADEVLEEQVLYLFWQCPMLGVSLSSLIPAFMCEVLGLRWRVRCFGRCVAVWCIFCCVFSILIPYLRGQWQGSFPYSASGYVTSTICTLALPCLLVALPRHLRLDTSLLSGAFVALGMVLSVIVLTGLGLPSLEYPLRKTVDSQAALQLVLVLPYPLIKLLFDAIGHFAYPIIGADAMPPFVFLWSISLQFGLCMSFHSGLGPAAFLELMVVDVVYHIYKAWQLQHCLRRPPPLSDEANSHSSLAVVPTQPLANSGASSSLFFQPSAPPCPLHIFNTSLSSSSWSTPTASFSNSWQSPPAASSTSLGRCSTGREGHGSPPTSSATTATTHDPRLFFASSALSLRGFTSVFLPFLFIIEVVLLSWFAPRHNNFVCWSESDEHARTLAYLITHLVIEALAVMFTSLWLNRHGIKPWQQLKGLSNRYFWIFSICICAANLYFLSLQHSHTGYDFGSGLQGFGGAPVRDGQAWDCGLRWYDPTISKRSQILPFLGL